MYDGSLPLAEVLQGIPTRFGLSEDLCEAWHVHGYKKFHKNDTPAATALLQVSLTHTLCCDAVSLSNGH